MELIEKLKKQLSEEYGIHSDQELMDAIAHQKPMQGRDSYVDSHFCVSGSTV